MAAAGNKAADQMLRASLVLATLIVLILGFSSAEPRRSSRDKVLEAKSDRGGRLFPVFQLVTFPNDVCEASGSRNGTCYTSEECANRGGTSSGTCASGFGVCCVFSLNCGQTTSDNCTYLVQSSTTDVTTNPCTYTICRCSSNVCRIRLDFTSFSIAGPVTGSANTGATYSPAAAGGAIGDCTTDTFSVTAPGNVGSPIICGVNTGQHMILDASDQCNVATFSTGGTGNTRMWDIKVTQYACGAERGGPDGCLQYFTGTSGTVASYNFPTTSSTIPVTATHLSNQNYHMCFRQEVGFCAICFTPSITGAIAPAQDSFGLSISADAAIGQAQVDSNCESDYLIIPGGMGDDPDGINFAVGTIAANGAARYCGRRLSATQGNADNTESVCTQLTPFRMTFITNDDEADLAIAANSMATVDELSEIPSGILGFSLNYQQISC